MANSDNTTYSRQTPPLVPLIVNAIFTLFAGVCSAFTIYITYAHFSTQRGWTVCAMSVISVCFFAGYCWYRLLTEQPSVKPEAVQEQMEEVWPPAPIRATPQNNKD